MKQHILGLEPAKTEEILEKNGFPKYRAGQLMEWVYKKRAASFADCKNLPAELLKFLEDNFILRSFRIEKTEESKIDGTTRYTFIAADGLPVTAVFLPMKNRNSVCISSQIGCPVKCPFCASGQAEFRRSLSAAELLEQILQIEKHRFPSGEGKLDSILFMGMGEPMLNYENLVTALRALTSQKMFGCGRRGIVVSTSGYVPQIEKLAGENIGVRLALSLHAPDDATRKKIMPAGFPFRVSDIFRAGLRYGRITKSRLTIEYILLSGINDSLEHATRLEGIIKKEKFYTDEIKINLIKYNDIVSGKWAAPPQERMEAFKNYLAGKGLLTIIREPKGADIGAACGQLGV